MNKVLILTFLSVFIYIGSLSAQYTGVPTAAYADSLFTAGKHEQALEAYKRLLSTDEDNYVYRFRTGLLLAWTGSYPEAETLLRGLYREFPEDTDVAAALIRVTSWQERFTEALRMTNTALDDHPDNLEFRELQLQLTFWRGELRKAAEMASSLASVAPDSEVVFLVQQAVKRSMRPHTVTTYIHAWDSERTQVHVFSQSLEVGLLPGTLINARADYAYTENTFTNTDGSAIRFSLGASHTYNRRWSAQLGLGGTYTAGQSAKLTPAGALIYNREPVRSTLSITRFLLTDTPALIENRIFQTESQLAANIALQQQEVNLRVNHSWLSDENRRFLLAGSYNYSINIGTFEYTPGFITEYRSFERSGFANGYFAPEWQVWFALMQQLRHSFVNDTVYGVLSAQTGLQQFKLHALPGGDPSLKFEFGVLAGYRLNDNWESELGYTYTNLAGVSAQSTAQDFWGQAIRFTVRGVF